MLRIVNELASIQDVLRVVERERNCDMRNRLLDEAYTRIGIIINNIDDLFGSSENFQRRNQTT